MRQTFVWHSLRQNQLASNVFLVFLWKWIILKFCYFSFSQHFVQSTRVKVSDKTDRFLTLQVMRSNPGGKCVIKIPSSCPGIQKWFYFPDDKLLVGLGITKDGLSGRLEIVDLIDSDLSNLSKVFINSNNCDNFNVFDFSWNEIQQFPSKLDRPAAGLIFGETPIICGSF